MLAFTLRRAVLAFALAAFGAAAFVHPLKPAYACSCVPARPPAEARDEAQAVFSGTVRVVQPNAAGVLVTFDVNQLWKGPEGAELTLSTSGNSASCGFEFVPGEQYLVYGFAQDGELSTNLCTRTAPLANAGADLAALGEGNPVSVAEPVPAPATEAGVAWAPLVLGGIALAGVGLIGFAMLRRR
jgi:hypothetical protein